MRTGPGQHFVFTVETDDNVSPGTVAFSLPQRKWATLSLNQEIGQITTTLIVTQGLL